MRKQVLFVQGGGEGAYEADAKLAGSLRTALGPDYEVLYPAMPNEGSPHPSVWSERLRAEIATLRDGAILVGHSLGATMLIAAISESADGLAIAGIFLIAAPFAGEGGWQSDDFKTPKHIGAKLSDEIPIHLYHCRDDDIVPFAHLGLYAKEFPQAVVHSLDGGGHQLDEDLSEVACDIRQVA